MHQLWPEPSRSDVALFTKVGKDISDKAKFLKKTTF